MIQLILDNSARTGREISLTYVIHLMLTGVKTQSESTECYELTKSTVIVTPSNSLTNHTVQSFMHYRLKQPCPFGKCN